MDIVIKGRRTSVPERFRTHVAEKLAKLEKLDHKVIRIDVELTAQVNSRKTDENERIELTLHSKGPVVRAEATAVDRYAALDLAIDKLSARLRKAADRRRTRRNNRVPASVAATAGAMVDNGASNERRLPSPAEPMDDGLAGWTSGEVRGHNPMIVREKTHRATPMTLDQALYEMELVGHDFYLFVDADSKMPSVVYRRRGYDYGVIHLDV